MHFVNIRLLSVLHEVVLSHWMFTYPKIIIFFRTIFFFWYTTIQWKNTHIHPSKTAETSSLTLTNLLSMFQIFCSSRCSVVMAAQLIGGGACAVPISLLPAPMCQWKNVSIWGYCKLWPAHICAACKFWRTMQLLWGLRCLAGSTQL